MATSAGASSSSSSSSSSSPCAACKFLRRKCTSECIFAAYFAPDQPLKFANVHKIFGASNVSKLLNDLPPHQREDAVNSLAYEAEARIKDPVYGCVGSISLLQLQITQLQQELRIAQGELARVSMMPPSHLLELNAARSHQLHLQQQQQQQQEQWIASPDYPYEFQGEEMQEQQQREQKQDQEQQQQHLRPRDLHPDS